MYFPLFLIAVDWGRWLYVIFSLLLILFLVVALNPVKILIIWIYLFIWQWFLHLDILERVGLNLTSANFCYLTIVILCCIII